MLAGWRRRPAALQVAATAVRHIGTRSDLAMLDIAVEPQDVADDIIEGARFAVMQRTLK